MDVQGGDQYVIAFEQASNHDVALIGGKCAGLASLIAAGATVPPGFAVTTRAYLETLAARNLECEIRARAQTRIPLADDCEVELLSFQIRGLWLRQRDRSVDARRRGFREDVRDAAVRTVHPLMEIYAANLF